MVNVVIADDNKEFCIALVNYVMKYNNDIRIADIVTDGNQAINTINEIRPEIILLDIKMPYFSGIDVMKKIKMINDYQPKFIFLSGDATGIMELNELTEDYVLIEKNTSYERIMAILNEIVNAFNIENKKRKIEEMLDLLNISRTSLGYKYLTQAIYMILFEASNTDNLENGLYKKMADNYEVSVLNIKWNIQKAVNSMWRYSDEKSVCELLGIKDNRKPTPKLIISVLSSKIRQKIN